MSSLYQYDVFRTVNDIIQFEEYVKSQLLTLQYIIYVPNETKISLFFTTLPNPDVINPIIAAYMDVPDAARRNVQSTSMYVNTLAPLTLPDITITTPISLSNNVIADLALCTTEDQAANKYYVDQRIAMSSVVNVDNISLEVSDNVIRIAAGAAGSGLAGGSGVPLSVMSYQPNITTVGELTDLTVAGETNLFGPITIPEPTLPNQPATKGYVDANTFQIGAGTGLTLTDNVLSVNSIQTQILQVGDLLNLTVTGALSASGPATFSSRVSIPAPELLTDATNKDYVDNLSYLNVSTGLSLVGNTLSVNPTLIHVTEIGTLTTLTVDGSATFSLAVTIPDPTSDAHAVNLRTLNKYSFLAGNGLSKNATTGVVNIQVDTTSIEIASNLLRVSSGIAGTGLTGGSGAPLSVNSVQPQITTIGTLTNLTVAGKVHIQDDTYSTADNIGALVVNGGIAADNIYLGALDVTGNAVFNGNVIVPYPTGSSNATSRDYVDSLIPTAGIGLLQTGNSFNINSSQPHITLLGTLQSLTVANSAIFLNGPVTVPPPLNASDAVTKAYVDAMSFGMKVQKTVAVATTVPIDISTTTVGSVIDGITLTVDQRILVKDQTNPIENGYYVVQSTGGLIRATDMQLGDSVAAYFVFVESGIVNRSSGWIVTNTNVIVGTSEVIFSKMSAAAQIESGAGITQTGSTLSIDTDNFSLEVGSTGLRISSLGIGSGLQGGSGTEISVSSAQPNITSVGILTSLNVSGQATFTGTVTVPTPTQAYQVATKGYIDNLSYLVAGIGLSKLNNVLSVNTVQTQIKQVGTLSSLSVANNIIVYGTTPATSPTDSAITVTGGISAGSLYISGSSSFTSTVTVPYPTNLSEAANKAYVDDQQIIAGTGLTNSNRTLSVNPIQAQIVQVGTLNDLHVYGNTVLEGPVTVPNPLNPTEPTTKQYVDSLSFLTLGVGLSKSATNIVSVETQLTHVTQVGILTTLAINGRLTVTGPATFNGGTVTVPTPIYATDAATKGYIDTVRDAIILQIPEAGTGLTLSPVSGSKPTFNVNPVQPQITKIGNLTGLDVTGTANFTGSVNVPTPENDSNAVTKAYADALAQGLKLSNSATVASTTNIDLAFLTRGVTIDGFTVDTNDRVLLKKQTNGVENGVYVIQSTGTAIRAADWDTGKHANGAFVFVASGSTNQATGWVCTNDPADDVVGSSSLTFTQFSAAGQYIMGSGMQKTGNTLSVKVDGFSIEISAGSLRVASTGVGTGLAGGSGTALAVKSTLPHVTSVGTLSSLNVSGAAVFTGTVSIPVPTLASSPVTKSYVDNLTYLIAGIGLTKSGSTLSVNPTLAHVTALGTLTALTVSGAATFQGLTTVPPPTANNSAVTKEYVDNQITSIKGGGGRTDAGTGLIRNGNIISVIPDQSQVTTVGTLTGLTVAGATIFQSTVTVPTPLAVTHAANKGYVDNLTYLLAGTGITKTGSTISVNASLPHVTTVGTLSGLTVAGEAVFNGKITVPTPTESTDAVNKAYCDSKSGTGGTGEIIQAGVGLTKTGSTLSVNSVQSQITVLGSLTGLSVSGNAIFSGSTVTVPAPTLATSATTKTYVDSLSYITVGAGLTKTNSILSVSSTQTLSDVLVTGKITIPIPVDDTDATTKAYVDGISYITAGTGLTKTNSTLSVNSSQSLTNLVVTDRATVPTPIEPTDAVTKEYCDSHTVQQTTGTTEFHKSVQKVPFTTTSTIMVPFMTYTTPLLQGGEYLIEVTLSCKGSNVVRTSLTIDGVGIAMDVRNMVANEVHDITWSTSVSKVATEDIDFIIKVGNKYPGTYASVLWSQISVTGVVADTTWYYKKIGAMSTTSKSTITYQSTTTPTLMTGTYKISMTVSYSATNTFRGVLSVDGVDRNEVIEKCAAYERKTISFVQTFTYTQASTHNLVFGFAPYYGDAAVVYEQTMLLTKIA